MKAILSYKGGTISLVNGVWTCVPAILNTDLNKARDMAGQDMQVIDQLIKMGAVMKSSEPYKNHVVNRVY